MNIKSAYDIIIVGAGPAGSMAAYAAAKNGASVLVLEKDKEVGVPVRCAEAVGKEGLENVLDEPPDPRWIAATIRKFQFVLSNGKTVHPNLPGTGYVLHRKLFDFDLAMRAANAGAQLVTRAYVHALNYKDDVVSGVEVQIEKQNYSIPAKVVIGADGVESRVGRWAGLKTTTKLRDMETCSQVTLANLDIDDQRCIFYFDQDNIPGGYAWLFPKGNGTANVGMGISGTYGRKKSVGARMDDFLETYFPEASVLNRTIGGVPCADRLAKISAPGLLLCGDAALQGNPLTGGGIITGMVGGKIAGKIAAEAVKENDVSEKYFQHYENEWDKRAGKAQKRYYKIKEAVKKLNNEQMNAAAEKLSALPHEKQTLSKIFQTALMHQPSMIVEVLKAFKPFA